MHPLLMELLPYVRQGYCCSQLLMLAALARRGEENDALVAAAHGLCHGLGEAGGPCGLLTGGAALLGVLAGRSPCRQPHPQFVPLVNEYALWFEEYTARFGGTACPQIAEGLALEAHPSQSGQAPNGPPDPLLCGALLGECLARLDELCEQYGVMTDA